jgi:hypothetical protein
MEERAKKDIEEMWSMLDGIKSDDIELDGLTVRAGNKVLKLEVVSEEPLDIEEEIRKEYRDKLIEKLNIIKKHINDKINSMSDFVSRIRFEYERKEEELTRKLHEAKLMPDVSVEDAKKGLSVVKGTGQDEYIWLVQGIYWPKTLDQEYIDPKYQKKMITPIVVLIETKGKKVQRVSTRQPIGLGYFQHYHQSNPDCWGRWKYPRNWETPIDIINIAQEAQIVLENINSGSLAERRPRGLPRYNTVCRHLTGEKKAPDNKVNLRREEKRVGVEENSNIDESDFWTS